MPSDTTTPGAAPSFSVELFMSSLAPQGAHGRQQLVMDRLEQLEQEGRIESITCDMWGDRICPETASRVSDGRNALQDISRLRQWAERNGASLTPFFTERQVNSINDESYTVIVPPILCLAISREDELWGVFPSLKNGQSLSAIDGIEAIAAETLPEVFTDKAPVQS